MVVQFLRNFGKVLGFDVNIDVPNLSVLQEGLLNIGDSMGEVQDLLVRLLSAAVCDPGLITGYKVKKNKIHLFNLYYQCINSWLYMLAEDCIDLLNFFYIASHEVKGRFASVIVGTNLEKPRS